MVRGRERFRREEGLKEHGARGRTTWLGLALAAVLIALALAPGPAAESEEPLIADGPAPDLILLYTGDVIGYLGPCG